MEKAAIAAYMAAMAVKGKGQDFRGSVPVQVVLSGGQGSHKGRTSAVVEPYYPIWYAAGSGQVLFQEGPDLVPTVHGLLLAVHGAVVVEEAVAGAVVAVELVRFVVSL